MAAGRTCGGWRLKGLGAQGRTLVPLTGLMVLGLLFLLMFIAMGMSYFGGTFRDPMPGASLAAPASSRASAGLPSAVYRGSAVLVSLAPGTDLGDPAVWKPALVLQVDPARTRRVFEVNARTGFTAWATDLEGPLPRQWAALPDLAAPQEAIVRATVSRRLRTCAAWVGGPRLLGGRWGGGRALHAASGRGRQSLSPGE